MLPRGRGKPHEFCRHDRLVITCGIWTSTSSIPIARPFRVNGPRPATLRNMKSLVLLSLWVDDRRRALVDNGDAMSRRVDPDAPADRQDQPRIGVTEVDASYATGGWSDTRRARGRTRRAAAVGRARMARERSRLAHPTETRPLPGRRGWACWDSPVRPCPNHFRHRPRKWRAQPATRNQQPKYRAERVRWSRRCSHSSRKFSGIY